MTDLDLLVMTFALVGSLVFLAFKQVWKEPDRDEENQE